MSDEKKVFTCNLDEILLDTPQPKEEDFIQEMVVLGPGIGLNIRAVNVQRDSSIKPNCWLHRLDEDGNSIKPLIFYPIVESRFSNQYGGHNKTAFEKIFKPVWDRLVPRMQEFLREDGSKAADQTAVSTVGENEIPF